MARQIEARLDRFTGLNTEPEPGGDRPEGESPDMLNFRITSDGMLVKREGYETVFQAMGELRGIWCGRLGAGALYAAVFGDRLYVSDRSFEWLSAVAGTVPGTGRMQLFPYMGDLYLLTGAGILRYDGETLAPIGAYVPLLTTATAPNGAGTPVDEVNALTPCVRQSFVPDGVSTRYVLAYQKVDSVDRVERGGTEIPANTWYWDDLTCSLVFITPPSAGFEELVVHYRLWREDADLPRKILNCRYACAFGGANDTRVFLYGSDDAPAVRYHSGFVNGSPSMDYFPALGYTLVGDGSPITGILRHYDRQLIFTEKAAYYSYLTYSEDTDGRQRALFPVLPLSDDRGNLAPGQPLLVNNEPCTVTAGGLFRWISTNVRDERNAVCFSQPFRRLLEAGDPKGAVLFNRKSTGELFVALGREVLVYRYGTGACYRYRLSAGPVRFFAELDGETYFGTDDCVFRAGGRRDDGVAFSAYWTSAYLTLGAKGAEKDLFSVIFCADTESGPSVLSFRFLTPEGTGGAEREVRFPAGSCSARRRVFASHRHFERVRLRLAENGDGPLRLRSIALSGKVNDKHL